MDFLDRFPIPIIMGTRGSVIKGTSTYVKTFALMNQNIAINTIHFLHGGWMDGHFEVFPTILFHIFQTQKKCIDGSFFCKWHETFTMIFVKTFWSKIYILQSRAWDLIWFECSLNQNRRMVITEKWGDCPRCHFSSPAQIWKLNPSQNIVFLPSYNCF